MDSELQLFTKGDTDGEYVAYERPTFAEGLPENHRENEIFSEVDNLGVLAENHVKAVDELTALKSAQPIIPESYTPPQMPEGIPVDEQAVTEFSALAKEIGLTQETFDKIVAFDLARAERYIKSARDSHDQAKTEAETALKGRWGNQYDVNKEMASSGLRKVLGAFEDGDEIEKSLAATGFLDNPEVMRLFRKIGMATSEDVFIKGSTSPPADGIPRDVAGRPILSYPKSDMPGDSRK